MISSYIIFLIKFIIVVYNILSLILFNILRYARVYDFAILIIKLKEKRINTIVLVWISVIYI